MQTAGGPGPATPHPSAPLRRSPRPAVFLDKDGTLIRDVPYNHDPARVELMPGAGRALARLAQAGYALVVVTDQPGIALGYYDLEALRRVRGRLDRLLAEHGVVLDGFFYCPHHPQARDPQYALACTCRKPLPGLLEQAAAALRLDLERSWMVGDILDDIEAGAVAGCRTVLLDVGGETEWRPGPGRMPGFRVTSLMEAAELILIETEAAQRWQAGRGETRVVALEPAGHEPGARVSSLTPGSSPRLPTAAAERSGGARSPPLARDADEGRVEPAVQGKTS